MGNWLCGPLIRAHRVPVCGLCEMTANKPWRSLSRNEKQLWFIYDGEFFCANCLISHQFVQLRESKPEEYKRTLTAGISERYPKGPRDWTPLKKVSSGKVWQNTSSFKAPYVPSPGLKAKLARVERRFRSPKSLEASDDLAASLTEPLSSASDEQCEKLIKYSASAPSALQADALATDRDELRRGLLPTVKERNHRSMTSFTDSGDSMSEEGQDLRQQLLM